LIRQAHIWKHFISVLKGDEVKLLGLVAMV
jgi:hypothetical protein